MRPIKMRDHPVEIQELVKELIRKKKGTHPQQDYPYCAMSTVSDMLYWQDTPQGEQFWKEISDGNYDKAKYYKCYPKAKDSIVNEYQIF